LWYLFLVTGFEWEGRRETEVSRTEEGTGNRGCPEAALDSIEESGL